MMRGPSVAIQGIWMAAQDCQGCAEAGWLLVRKRRMRGRRRRRGFRPELLIQAVGASCLPGAQQRHPGTGSAPYLPCGLVGVLPLLG